MSDYEELIKNLRSIKDTWQTQEEEWMLQAADTIEKLMALTAVDAKPVVRGEWEDCAVELDSRSNRHDYQCQKCGYPADYFICGSEDWWCAYEPNFCPHCGADMRKEVKQ